MFGWGITAGNFGTNAYYDGTNWRYIGAAVAAVISVGSTGWSFISAPSGAAGAVATMAGKMSLDFSGNLNTAGGISGTTVTTSGNINGGAAILATGAVYAQRSTANNYCLFADSGNCYQQFESNWYWAWNRSSGQLTWVYAGTSLFWLDSGGGAHSHGQLTCGSGQLVSSGASNPAVTAYNTAIGWAGGFWVNTSPSAIQFGSCDGNGNPNGSYGYLAAAGIGVYGTDGSFAVNGGANSPWWGNASSFNVPGDAWKPGGGAWADSSDARIKTELGEYKTGLEAILALRPIRYTFKDNWKRNPTKDPQSLHREVVAQGRAFIGLVAQETEIVMPEMVGMMSAEIDGEPVDDLRTLDMTALPLALVNAIKELSARLVALETRL
jgi:hypothetical protein